jgi:hypothetical protein
MERGISLHRVEQYLRKPFEKSISVGRCIDVSRHFEVAPQTKICYLRILQAYADKMGLQGAHEQMITPLIRGQV